MRDAFLMMPAGRRPAVYRYEEVAEAGAAHVVFIRRRFPADQANKIGSPQLGVHLSHLARRASNAERRNRTKTRSKGGIVGGGGHDANGSCERRAIVGESYEGRWGEEGAHM
uniref:Uncharacterized protein n=1 Tax=Plectus sambesii TaxID=2011161 RepID=A0A914XS06_9BILA